MWVLIITLGTRGDVQPYAVLAAGLAARGHHVTLCGPASLSHLATQLCGGTVDVFGLEGDWERLLQTEEARRGVNRQDLPGLLKVLQTFAEKHYVANSMRCLEVASGSIGSLPDVVVGNLTAWDIVLPLAEGLSCPFVFTAFAPPTLPSPSHPPPILHPRPLPLPWLNVAAGWLTHFVIKCMMGRNVEDILDFQDMVGCRQLTPVRLLVDRVRYAPFLLTYSPTLSPLPDGWEHEDVVACGYLYPRLLLARSDGGEGEGEEDGSGRSVHMTLRRAVSSPILLGGSREDTAAVSQWLREAQDRGEGPPVYVGFGSMIPNRGVLARVALEALMLTGRRGVLQKGWARISGSLLNPLDPREAAILSYAREHVMEVEGDVPHAWLFTHCAVVVHHGGCGTTHTALEAGVPQVVLPVAADQPYWAYRVGVLGVGPRHRYTAHRVTARRLARLIEAAASDPYRTKAREVGEHVRMHEDGLTRCVEAVEALDRKGGKAFWAELRAAEKKRIRAQESIVNSLWAVVGILALGALARSIVKRTRIV